MPGRRVRVNENSPWPERVGCEGVVVDPAIFNGVYPADKPLRGSVIILLDSDPLKNYAWAARNPEWTCVIDTRSVTSLP